MLMSCTTKLLLPAAGCHAVPLCTAKHVCIAGDAASGGLDLALGLNVGATPLTGLGPAVVLEALVCGASPQAAVQGMAALPVVRVEDLA